MGISNSSGTAGLKQGVCSSTTRPTAPFEGQMIYETDTDMVAIWNGTAWRYIAATTPTNGTVLQVQSTTVTSQPTTSTNSMTDISGMSVTITPKSTSSKILVTGVFNVGMDSTDDMWFNLVRGSTVLGGAGGAINPTWYQRGNAYSNQVLQVMPFPINYLDSPATTSATTYKLQWFPRVGSLSLNKRWNDQNVALVSTITVQEIAG
jgi:hypothetical protein